MDPKPRLFRTRAAWRSWLARRHDREREIWLLYGKKGSGMTSVSYEEALEEALCFGWIDSKVARVDAGTYKQRYTPRKAGSVWSAANKSRIERLTAAGRMAPPGMAKVAAAKRDGSWERLSDAERVGRDAAVPSDLLEALFEDGRAREVFEKRPPSEKRLWAAWIMSAKKPETRARRIAATVRGVLAGRRPGF